MVSRFCATVRVSSCAFTICGWSGFAAAIPMLSHRMPPASMHRGARFAPFVFIGRLTSQEFPSCNPLLSYLQSKTASPPFSSLAQGPFLPSRLPPAPWSCPPENKRSVPLPSGHGPILCHKLSAVRSKRHFHRLARALSSPRGATPDPSPPPPPAPAASHPPPEKEPVGFHGALRWNSPCGKAAPVRLLRPRA